MRARLFAVLLGLGLLVRLATLPLPGNDDVIVWKLWSFAATNDLTGMYGVGGTPTTRGLVTWGEHTGTVEYPPVFLYEYAIVGHVYRAIFPEFPDTLALLVAVKLPILFANAGLTWLLYTSARRASGREDVGRWAALAYWLNPATIAGGEMLGYVDVLFTWPAVAGLVLAWRGRRWSAGALAGLAIATKPQALLLGPAMALVLWQTGGIIAVLEVGAACLGILAAAVAPYRLRGATANMILAFGVFYERRDTMSAFAANLGWIVNWALRSSMGVPELGWRAYLQVVPRPLAISRFRELGYPDPRPLCAAAVATATLWATWVSSRARTLASSAALGAFTVHAFFVLNVGAHENHQLLEIPLLVLAAALAPAFRPLLVAVSGIVTLNINFYYGISLGWGWAIPRQITGIDVSVAIAIANVAVLGWFAALLLAPGAAPLERDA